MNRSVLLVALGSMLGGVVRYLASLSIAQHYVSDFPFGTFAVNLTGSFLVGTIYGLAERHEWLSSDLRLFLAVGFCGGFTTFSAFAFENAELLRGSHYFSFIAYAALTFILGIGCAAAGYAVGKI